MVVLFFFIILFLFIFSSSTCLINFLDVLDNLRIRSAIIADTDAGRFMYSFSLTFFSFVFFVFFCFLNFDNEIYIVFNMLLHPFFCFCIGGVVSTVSTVPKDKLSASLNGYSSKVDLYKELFFLVAMPLMTMKKEILQKATVCSQNFLYKLIVYRFGIVWDLAQISRVSAWRTDSESGQHVFFGASTLNPKWDVTIVGEKNPHKLIPTDYGLSWEFVSCSTLLSPPLSSIFIYLFLYFVYLYFLFSIPTFYMYILYLFLISCSFLYRYSFRHGRSYPSRE